MEKEVLEVVLKKSAKESKIKRIIDMKWESALPKGENYTSNILRITLKVVLGNGRVGKKSFIAKKEIVGEAATQLNKECQVFKKEASVYTDIFREMDYMMEEFADTEGPLWCELIYFNSADGLIILEDLKASGFSTVKRTELQDIEHARLALRSLGRFHAMAKVLEGRGHISKYDYKPYGLIFHEPYIRNFIYGGIQALIKGMRASWGKEWADTADKLDEMTFEELSKRMRESADFDEDTFKCLNHGDCWNNNMMFKHNWEGRPIEISTSRQFLREWTPEEEEEQNVVGEDDRKKSSSNESSEERRPVDIEELEDIINDKRRQIVCKTRTTALLKVECRKYGRSNITTIWSHWREEQPDL
nr:uncharacterized protein LOC106682007 [Halyomorpha halys]